MHFAQLQVIITNRMNHFPFGNVFTDYVYGETMLFILSIIFPATRTISISSKSNDKNYNTE
jgi:hypothetical protein